MGFDLNKERVAELMTGHDSTLEVEDALLRDAIDNHEFRCTTDIGHIRDCNFYVVAVPTPVDANNRPDLRPLLGASETVGKVISGATSSSTNRPSTPVSRKKSVSRSWSASPG